MKSPKKDTKRKIAAAIALFLAFLMILGAIAPFIYGAELSSKATISAQVGYSGLYKVGYPTPVWVEVKTGDSSFDGEILIRVPFSGNIYNSYGFNDEEQYIDYAYPITMNANETRNVELEITINTIPQSGGLKVALFDKKGKEVGTSLSTFGIGSSVFTAYSPENVLIGILSDNPAGLSHIKGNYYNGLMKSYSSKQIPDLTIDNFPNNLGALSAFNIIYINDFDTSRLSNMSRDALKSWVNGGGVLYVGSGENYAKTLKGLENIIDIENTERIVSADLEDLFFSYDEEMYDNLLELVPDEVADKEPAADTEAEPEADENKEDAIMPESEEDEDDTTSGRTNPFADEKTAINPIVFEFPVLGKTDNAINTLLYSALNVGQGKVVLFPFNLSEGAVQRSDRFNELLARVAQKEVTEAIDNGYIEPNRGAGLVVSRYNLTSIPYQSEGITRVISALVILYVVVVGPVLFLILRKKDKKEKGFVIIPIIAVSVTVIIFVMSLNTIYKRPVLNEVSSINIQSGERYSIKNSSIAILTGKKGDVAVRMGNYGLSINPRVGEDYYGYYGYGNHKALKVIYGDQPGITYYDNERWETNVFGVMEEIDLQGAITADIILENGVYKGIIANNTPYDLKEVVLSFGTRGYKRIDNINAGEEFILNDDLQDKETLHYDMYSLLWSYSSPYGSRPKNDAQQVEGWRRMMYRYIVEGNINNSRYYSSSYRSSYSQYAPINVNNVTMYAYIGDNVGSVNATVSGAVPISFHNNAVVMDIECTYILDSKGYDLPFGFISVSEIRANSYYDASVDYGIYPDMNDSMEFVYDLEDFDNLQSFMFSKNMETNNYGQPVDIEIYNYKLKQWEELNYRQYENVQDYISEKFKLIIRIDCRKLDHLNFPEIQLKGGVR